MTRPDDIQQLEPDTAYAWVGAGAVLVDVREPHEVAAMAYDVPAILHIPLSEWEERYHEIPRDKPVVMACRIGGRSQQAAMYLVMQGYSIDYVANLAYGIVGWSQRGLPVHR